MHCERHKLCLTELQRGAAVRLPRPRGTQPLANNPNVASAELESARTTAYIILLRSADTSATIIVRPNGWVVGRRTLEHLLCIADYVYARVVYSSSGAGSGDK